MRSANYPPRRGTSPGSGPRSASSAAVAGASGPKSSGSTSRRSLCASRTVNSAAEKRSQDEECEGPVAMSPVCRKRSSVDRAGAAASLRGATCDRLG